MFVLSDWTTHESPGLHSFGIMNAGQLILQTGIFCYVLWLGLYLLARDVRTRVMAFAAAGSLTYALMLAFDLIDQSGPAPELLSRISWPLPLLLSLFWVLATLALLPDDTAFHKYYPYLLGIYSAFYLIAVGTPLIFDYGALQPSPTIGYPFFVGAVVLPLVASVVVLVRLHPRYTRTALILATLFAILGGASLLLVWNILPRTLLLLSLATDLALFGGAIALLDAHGQGEVLLPHFLRSLDAALLTALIFGGQIGLVMLLSTGVTSPMVVLLLTTCSAAIGLQVFADPLQHLLDNLTFLNAPRLRQSRAELRDVASNLPRLNEAQDVQRLGEEEFVWLTRRALSNFGNLPRLATNPLTMLPQIEQRIVDRSAPLNALERAAELKLLLAESIECLKPRDGGRFGTSDEWRYYNALYFPYVCGLKPYSRKDRDDALPVHVQEALAWFQGQVPERTLHNWQNAAARLVAHNLRENWQ
jgi:hypothetical protein